MMMVYYNDDSVCVMCICVCWVFTWNIPTFKWDGHDLTT